MFILKTKQQLKRNMVGSIVIKLCCKSLGVLKQ